MVNPTDIHSLTEFQRNARELIGKAKQSKSPLVLTVNGRAEVVLQDAAAYEALVDRLCQLEDLAAIREGLAEAEAGQVRPAEEFFGEFFRQHGISG